MIIRNYLLVNGRNKSLVLEVDTKLVTLSGVWLLNTYCLFVTFKHNVDKKISLTFLQSIAPLHYARFFKTKYNGKQFKKGLLKGQL